jgi:hypothetical protein
MNKMKEEQSPHSFEDEIDMNGPMVYHLGPFEECSGILKNISKKNGMLLVTFSIEKTIAISQKTNINERIQQLIGKHIGILNSGDNYHIRIICGEKEVDAWASI